MPRQELGTQQEQASSSSLTVRGFPKDCVVWNAKRNTVSSGDLKLITIFIRDSVLSGVYKGMEL